MHVFSRPNPLPLPPPRRVGRFGVAGTFLFWLAAVHAQGVAPSASAGAEGGAPDPEVTSAPGGADLSARGADPEIIASTSSTGAAPILLTQPVDRAVREGAAASFSVAVAPTASIVSFTWRRDGIALPGAHAANYAIASVGRTDAGRYTCEVSNAAGSAVSTPATLTVTPAVQPGRFVSFSVVTSLERANTTLALECALGGAGTSGAKPVLIRAAGPSLARFGVLNFNPDPQIELYSGGTKTGGNDQWAGLPAIVEAAARVGAFAFVASDSTDAALLVDPAAAESTIRISGVGGATGLVLAEIYDATPVAALTPTTPRLTKFSVLTAIPAGATLSTGFVIAGQTPKTVLIRAVGPALAGLGVADALTHPVLTLFRDSTPIALNERWGGSPELRQAFASVGALPLEAASADAAVMIRLAPGSYAVEAAEANNAGGTALVEIYEVP